MKEVNTQVFESKKVDGLFFAGEVLDVHNISGGFNFQNAWTSAWLVAEALAVKE